MTQTAPSHDPKINLPWVWSSLDYMDVMLNTRNCVKYNMHHILLFSVIKGFRFMLVYSCLHYLLFKNEKLKNKTI